MVNSSNFPDRPSLRRSLGDGASVFGCSSVVDAITAFGASSFKDATSLWERSN
jgi:hypothetical protein